uniref:non-specific serine/threonine protein kinase n=1 Tax=Oryza rufipogon TaxID=4529 RepID=A0A0E0P4R3_ORYRU
MLQLLLLLLLLLSISLDVSHLIAEAAAAAKPPVSFSFNFSDPSTYSLDDLLFEGDAAKPKDGLVDLTSGRSCYPYCPAGRMSYAHPVQLYDDTTGGEKVVVASFSTRFTFTIRPIDDGIRGDGLAFFLASYPSKLPANSFGGNLGLINNGTTTAFGSDRFIAVEFDTYNNTFDPKSINHIGIDINSVVSSLNTTLLPNFSLNGTMTAHIEFNGITQMLVASLWLAGRPWSAAPDYQVSLRLPDPITSLLLPQVAVGFTGATADLKELNQIMLWSFNSTLTLVNQDRRNKALLFGGPIIGGAVALALVLWFLISCLMQKRVRNTFGKGTGGARRFEYDDLAIATGNFSDDRKLGEGAFGVVYSGFLKRLEREVAVKKIVRESSQEHKDFFAEVSTISEAKHKNLVKFFGWCCRGHSWNILRFMYKIAKDIGSGLLYLHHECYPYIIHRDIKPGNVLLDDDFNAKLADFGLSRVANPNNATLKTTAIGSQGYIDPQCMKDGEVSFNRNSDVYSFGIALLEIVCARKHREQIWGLYKSGGDVVEAADSRLAIGVDGAERREMERAIILGLWCSVFETKHRPTMLQAMDVLERDAQLPDLNLIVNSNLSSTDASSSSPVEKRYDSEEAPLVAGSSSSQLAGR